MASHASDVHRMETDTSAAAAVSAAWTRTIGVLLLGVDVGLDCGGLDRDNLRGFVLA
jgi:hypothetical protein